jgi:hypothetical protein
MTSISEAAGISITPTLSPAQTAVLSTYELLEAVLSNLNAPDLIDATAVCKTWRDIIERSAIIRIQLQNTHNDDLPLTSDGQYYSFELNRISFLIRGTRGREIIYAVFASSSKQREFTHLVDGNIRSLRFRPICSMTWEVTYEDRSCGYRCDGNIGFSYGPLREYLKEFHVTKEAWEGRMRIPGTE